MLDHGQLWSLFENESGRRSKSASSEALARPARRGAVAVAAGAAHAEYPDKPVRIVVPFIAGSAPDVAARQAAQRLTERLGQQFIIENKPGAAGNIGAEVAARAAPDGYTLLLLTSSHVCRTSTSTRGSTTTPAKDFVPITMITRIPSLMVVPPSSPAKTVAGVHRARQGQSRQAELRLGRRRQPGASLGRGVPFRRRHRLHPRALQGRARHRAGAARRADPGRLSRPCRRRSVRRSRASCGRSPSPAPSAPR